MLQVLKLHAHQQHSNYSHSQQQQIDVAKLTRVCSESQPLNGNQQSIVYVVLRNLGRSSVRMFVFVSELDCTSVQQDYFTTFGAHADKDEKLTSKYVTLIYVAPTDAIRNLSLQQ